MSTNFKSYRITCTDGLSTVIVPLVSYCLWMNERGIESATPDSLHP